MRDVTEAHFLHQRSGLEPVLRPPVSSPSALAWVPGREELIVASADGTVHAVDPVLGTRVIQSGLGDPVRISIHPDRKRYIVVSRGGQWLIGKISGGLTGGGRHPFTGGWQVFWAGEYAVVAGDEGDARGVLIISDGKERARLPLPAGAVPLVGEDGKLLAARSTPAGLEVLKLGRNTRFSDLEATAHELRTCGGYVLGFTATGVAVWTREGGQPRSMRLPDLTAGDVNPKGDWLGLGTRTGAVALAALSKVDARAKPHLVKAFEQPVQCLAFSERGQWLATGAESLQIWTWES